MKKKKFLKFNIELGNRYFMSHGGPWCPSTAGTRWAPRVNLRQAEFLVLAS